MDNSSVSKTGSAALKFDSYTGANSAAMPRHNTAPQPCGPTPTEKAHKREVQARNRPIKACMECRRRKAKCDRKGPCSACTKDGRECHYVPDALSPEELAKFNQIKQGNRALESALEQEVARPVTKKKARKHPSNQKPEMSPSESDDDKLQVTQFAVSAAAYEDDADDDDDILDMGFQLGKARLTDRVGGYFRPRMAEEMTSLLLHDAKNDQRSPQEKAADLTYPIHILGASTASGFIFTPGPTYLAPASPFFFSEPAHMSIEDCYPTKYKADIIMEQYWRRVHPVARTVHRPSFQRAYEAFFLDPSHTHTPTSTQALVFAVLFSSIVSMDGNEYIREFGYSEQTWFRKLQLATETLLGRAHIARTTKLETLQAFVVYLIPLCRADVGRVHSTLVASAIRIAECMGLHRDGTEYGLGPVLTHVRRMVWHQLCFLDIRAYEAQGPRMIIREEEFTTQFPLNVDDHELELISPPKDDADRWTDMTLSRIRMESHEIFRRIYKDRERIGSGPTQISVTDVLWYIYDFRNRLIQKYCHMLDKEDPLQDYALQNVFFHPSRMPAMVLHRYQMSVSERMPERLRQKMIDNGLECLQLTMKMETEEKYKPWRWYAGALQQHHMALLMLMEVFMFPSRKEAAQIWKCLDWVFEVPDFIHPQQKGRYVMANFRDQMAQYVFAKKLRCPTAMNTALPSPTPRKSTRPPKSSLDTSTPPGYGQLGSSSNIAGGFRESAVTTGMSAYDLDVNTAKIEMPGTYRHTQGSNSNISSSLDVPMTGLCRAAYIQGGGLSTIPEMEIDWVRCLLLPCYRSKRVLIFLWFLYNQMYPAVANTGAPSRQPSQTPTCLPTPAHSEPGQFNEETSSWHGDGDSRKVTHHFRSSNEYTGVDADGSSHLQGHDFKSTNADDFETSSSQYRDQYTKSAQQNDDGNGFGSTPSYQFIRNMNFGNPGEIDVKRNSLVCASSHQTHDTTNGGMGLFKWLP